MNATAEPEVKEHESATFPEDLAHFKQIVLEGAFFICTFFFLLLGFSTELTDSAGAPLRRSGAPSGRGPTRPCRWHLSRRAPQVPKPG